MAVAHVKGAAGYSDNGSPGFTGVFSSNTASTTSSKAFSYTPLTAGNAVLLWVVMIPTTTSPTTCSLSATGWVFSQIGGIVNGGTTSGCGALFSAYAPNTAAATITMTWNQPTNHWFNVLIDEFSGVDGTTITAGSNGATGSGTPTISVTPTVNNTMVWVACNDSITAVGSIGDSAATKGSDDTQSDWSEYRLLTGVSGVAQSCTVTGSGSYLIGVVAIKEAGSDPTVGSVPSGTAITRGSLSAKFLFFDTGDFSSGV